MRMSQYSHPPYFSSSQKYKKTYPKRINAGIMRVIGFLPNAIAGININRVKNAAQCSGLLVASSILIKAAKKNTPKTANIFSPSKKTSNRLNANYLLWGFAFFNYPFNWFDLSFAGLFRRLTTVPAASTQSSSSRVKAWWFLVFK